MSIALGPRLARIRASVELLARLDPTHQIFGASEHRWTFAPPFTPAEVGALARSLGGVTLPEEYLAFTTSLGRAGAGPYYGLETPRAVGTDDVDGPAGRPELPFPWTDGAELDAALPDGARRYDGAVYLATQGCGYFSILVVTGPAAGSVWADTSQGGGPLVAESPSFLAFYEAWIDRALLEWAEKNLALVAAHRADDDRPHEGVEAVRPLLERAAKEQRTALRVRLSGALALYDRAYEQALALADEMATLEAEEPERRRRLDRARVRAAQGLWSEALAEAEAGLAAGGWFSTRDELRVEQTRALERLGRFREALDALEARAQDTYFDTDAFDALTLAALAAGDVARAERAVRLAVERGAGSTMRFALTLGSQERRVNHQRELPFAERVEDVLAPLIRRLEDTGRTKDAMAMAKLRDTLLSAGE